MPDRPDAKVVILKQTEARVPEFNRYAARLKARGCVVSRGDLLIVYKVDATIPEGPVLVTDATRFVFAA